MKQDEWGPLTPPAAPSAGDEWGPLTPPAPARAAAPARQPAAAPQQPVDPGYPETYNPAPGLIATTPGRARTGPGSYRGTSDDPVPLDDLSPEQIFNLPPGIFVRYPSGEIDQFSRVNPNAGATPTRIERGAQRQYGVLPADEQAGPRTLGERFTSTFENLVNEGVPASVGRFVVGAADRSGYRTDPATGERYYVADVGQLTRNAERARRFNFERTTQGDEWYRQQGLINQMLAGGVTLAGGLAGGATDASNYAGGWGKNILTRAAGNLGFGAAQDVALQGLDIGSGVQEGYDPVRTLIAGGLNAAIPLGVEGAGRIFNRFAPNGTPELYGPPVPDGVGSPRQPATLPDVEVTAAAPGAVERIAAARKELADVNAALAAVEGEAIPSELLARRDAARAELSAAAAATPPVPAAALPDVVVPDDFGPLRPPETSAAAPAAVAASAAQPPIVRHRETAAIVEAAAPPVAEGMTRLWRGNRPNETGAGLNFTNDLPGIALPFREAYGGELSYVDVPSSQLADFEIKAGAAPGAEFHLPANLAATARVAALEAPAAPVIVPDFGPLRPPEARVLAEDVGAPGRTPDEVLLGPAVRALDDEFGIPPQPSPVNAAVLRALDADPLSRPPIDVPDADKIGNLNLNRLDPAERMEDARRLTDAQVGGFEDARTFGARTFDEVDAAADEIKMTARDFLAKEGALTNVDIEGGRRLETAATKRTERLRTQLKETPNDPILLAQAKVALAEEAAITARMTQARADTGRALGIFNKTPRRDAVSLDMLTAWADSLDDVDLRNLVNDLNKAGSPAARRAKLAAAYKPTFGDMLVEGWRALLVSGPKTILLNILTSGATVALRQPQVFAVASILGGIRKVLGLGPQNDRVLGTEVGARIAGMVAGAVTVSKGTDGFFDLKFSSPAGGDFLNTIKTGTTTDGRTQFETNVRQKAIPGRLGSAIRAPMTLQSASDEFVKATARASDLAGMAVRIAHQEGLRGGAAQKRVAELLANPTEDMLKGAQSYARYNTLQDDLGGGGRGFNQLASAWKAVTIAVPFVRTIINLTKQSVEHSLLAPVLKSWRQDLMAGGARSDLALAKVITGTAWATGFGALAQSGIVTGAPPTDPAERETLLATGWQPYSIRTPDGGYVSYRNAAPFSMFIGMAATLGQPIGQPKTEAERDAMAQELFVSFLSQMYDQAFMRGGTDAVSTLDDPTGNRLMTWAKRTAATIVVPPIVSQTAKMFSPEMKAPDTLGEHIAARVGLGRPARNITGETTSPAGGFAALSPFTINAARNDPIANMILESGHNVRKPNRTIDDKRLPADVYERYQAETGAQIRNNMAWYLENPQVWNSMSQEERADETKRQVDRARETARQNLGLSQ